MASRRAAVLAGGLEAPPALVRHENLMEHGVPRGAEEFSSVRHRNAAAAPRSAIEGWGGTPPPPLAPGAYTTPPKLKRHRSAVEQTPAVPVPVAPTTSKAGKRAVSSSVWQHFNAVFDPANPSKRSGGTCFHCGALVPTKSANTSGLHRHLESAHPEIARTLQKKGTLPENKQRRLERALGIMILTDSTPLSIMEKRGFQLFVRELNPGFRIPDRHTVYKNHISKLWKTHHEDISKDFDDRPFMLIIDTWDAARGPMSACHRGFLGVYATTVTLQWQRVHACLGIVRVRDHHDAPKLLARTREILAEYKLAERNMAALASDNNKTETAVAQALKGSADTYHVRCYAHTLNLAVDDVFEVVERAATILSVCHEIVGAFMSRRLRGDALERVQRVAAPDHKPLSLVQNNDTRWNSEYMMLGRLAKLYPFVDSVLKDENTPAVTALRGRLFSVISDVPYLLTILKRCKIATDRMESERGLLSQLLPVSDDLEGYLEVRLLLRL
jgi:BED zinc finger